MDLLGDAASALAYSCEPVLLLFGDDEEGLGRARAAARRVGCRIAAEASIEGGAQRLEHQIGYDATLLTLASSSADPDALLAGLRSVGARGIVVAPPDMIDLIFAADLPIHVDELVAPDPAELEQAIARATGGTPEHFHDRNGPLNMLQQLSEDAARIATALASLSGDESDAAEINGVLDPTNPTLIRKVIRARRLRDRFFNGGVFADPAFDMLLDLYAARLEGSRVAVSSLCIAAAVPPTTALRWIRQLTDKGLFVRQADPDDARRVYIALSEDAAQSMERYLNAIRRGNPPVI